YLFSPQVKKTGIATVWLNGDIASVVFPLHYKDIIFPPLTAHHERITITKSGILDIRDALEDPMAKENHVSCNFLFVVSEDDLNWNSAYYAEQACNILKHGKTNYEVLRHPNTGYFLEVPYMPHYPSGVHAAVGQVVAFEGETKVHADAQVDTWRRVQEFFRLHLQFSSSTSHLKIFQY
uniref:BAAT/Acyl-CoA thioester hydrolase C-terminal domain-containing protein n=1 Tax=Pygocentrus nattereri TaxID=42514 RepID=A0A3B4DSR7_PYGNA